MALKRKPRPAISKLAPRERMKPRAKAAPDVMERVHLDRIGAMGCLVCGAAAHIHHLMRAPGKIRRRDHRFVAPLCQSHHQGNAGVHGLGSEAAFERVHGVGALAEWAVREWEITCASVT